MRSLLCILAAIGVGLLLASSPVSAATVNVPLSSASLGAPLRFGTDSVGDTQVIALPSYARTFAEIAGLLGCEEVFSSSSGLRGLGGGTSYWIGTAGGQRALLSNANTPAGKFARYSNNCALGYNESAQLMLRANLYLKLNTTGSFAGSLYLGFAFQTGTNAADLCGPFVELHLGSTGTIASLRTGVSKNGNPTSNFQILYGTPSTPSSPLANQTWYTLALFQNKTTQNAYILGGGSLVTASSSFTWSVPQCGAATQSQEAGITLLQNQTQGGVTPVTVAWNNVTIGTGGAAAASLPARTGYMTFSLTPASKLSTMTVSFRSYPTRYNVAGSSYVTAASGGLCPCYVNNTAGGTLWSDVTTHTTLNYTTTPFTFTIAGVSPGAVTIALRINATDGLGSTIVLSLTIPGTNLWQNPGQGTASGAAIQEGNWLGPLVAVVLVSLIAYAFFEAFREGINQHR